MLVPEETEADVIEWTGCLPLADPRPALTETSKTWLAIGLFVAAVGAASLGLAALPIALGVVVVVALCADTHRAGRRSLRSHRMAGRGAARLHDPAWRRARRLGRHRADRRALNAITEGLPAWAVLTLLMVVTMTLSDILNNAATTIVAAPVAIAMAERLGVSPDPFLMGVAVAASCAFLTPVGHQNNTLILGPGGYRFRDYWPMGLPLEILVIAVSVPAILYFWPL
jgi:hypothetical protein